MTESDVVAELDLWIETRKRIGDEPTADLLVMQRALAEIVALRMENDAFRDRLSEMIAEKVAVAQLRPWQFQPEPDTPGLFIQCVNAEQRDRIIRALKDDVFWEGRL